MKPTSKVMRSFFDSLGFGLSQQIKWTKDSSRRGQGGERKLSGLGKNKMEKSVACIVLGFKDHQSFCMAGLVRIIKPISISSLWMFLFLLVTCSSQSG